MEHSLYEELLLFLINLLHGNIRFGTPAPPLLVLWNIVFLFILWFFSPHPIRN